MPGGARCGGGGRGRGRGGAWDCGGASMPRSVASGRGAGGRGGGAGVRWPAAETNRVSADGNPTLCTSMVVPGGLPRAIPVSVMPKIHTER
jgi:hypothetical protein